jgi:hypothetical protein
MTARFRNVIMALTKNSTLQMLTLAHNRIGEPRVRDNAMSRTRTLGGHAITLALEKNAILRTLDLAYNRISPGRILSATVSAELEY